MFVNNSQDVKNAKAKKLLYVTCTCPSCGDVSTLLLVNAEKVIKDGKCLYCDEKDGDYYSIGILK